MHDECFAQSGVTGRLMPFAAFLQGTPVIPEIYWNVYSSEQRWKVICERLEGLIAYVDEVKDVVNVNSADIAAMKQLLYDIRDGKYADLYLDAIASYIDENLTQFVARIARYAFPQLVWDGEAWRYSIVVPTSWDFLRFRWTYFAEDGTYHLTLNY